MCNCKEGKCTNCWGKKVGVLVVIFFAAIGIWGLISGKLK